MVLEWPYGNHADARRLAEHINNRIEPGHHWSRRRRHFLSEDGAHLYWFSNQARRLQRDGVRPFHQDDLEQAGGPTSAERTVRILLDHAPRVFRARPEACEESCPSADAWVPEEGVGSFFLLTLFCGGNRHKQFYQSTSVLSRESAGKWRQRPSNPPLRQVLDAANAGGNP